MVSLSWNMVAQASFMLVASANFFVRLKLLVLTVPVIGVRMFAAP